MNLLSIIETPVHPNFSQLYAKLGFDLAYVNSMRKAINVVKKSPVDVIVAEFIYGYGNDYAGVTVSNVDVLLYSLQRYKQEPKVILLVDKSEQKFIDKLPDILPIHAVLTHPVNPAQIAAALAADKQ